MKFLTTLVLFFLLSACTDNPGTRNENPLHLPPAGFVGNSVQGKVLFEQNCISCHGKEAGGTADKGPPLVDKTYRPGHHADLSFHLAVSVGVRSHHWNFGDMKPVPGLSPESVEHIIRYVRELQKQSGIQQ